MKDRIKAIRAHFALTQEQFARKIGKTTGFISNVETGRSGLSDGTIHAICSSFSVNEEWLRTGNGEMFAAPSPPIDKNSIGNRVKEVRKESGLTQQEFANRVGFHKNQIYNVENGKTIPSDDFLLAVSRAFRVSIIWLKTGSGEMKVDPVDDRLIEWLRKHPDVAMELRVRGGLD